MANIVPAATPTPTPRADSTLSRLRIWQPHHQLPDGLTLERINSDLVELADAHPPCGKSEFAKALRYLLAAGITIAQQQPDLPEPVEIYFRELRQYPADVIARAIRQVVRTHKWPTLPVLPAQIIEAAESDTKWRQISEGRTTLELARMRLASDAHGREMAKRYSNAS